MKHWICLSFVACVCPGCVYESTTPNPTSVLGETRRWTGEEHFAIPLHDWSRKDGNLIAQHAHFGGAWRGAWTRLYKSTSTIGELGSFTTSFTIHCVSETPVAKPAKGANRKKGRNAAKKRLRAGIWLGLKSQTPSPQNVWIHPRDAFFVGLSEGRRLIVGKASSKETFDPHTPVAVVVSGAVGTSSDILTITATPKGGESIEVTTKLPTAALTGSLCLVARGIGTTWNFGDWKLDGDAVVKHPDRAVGPILWTQYTRQDSGTVKLQAQMVPLEESDSQLAALQFQRNGEWQTVCRSKLDPLSATFLFRVDNVQDSESVPYRVVYRHGDTDHEWEGSIRPNPRQENEFKLGVFNCDHGELFPQDTMVRNVRAQNPDMLFYAGDQIYGIMDNVRTVRSPLEGARLSYLSKWYQFGLTWRSLLKDRPSVIIPDDHDVFMGNVWGDSGRGYVMDPVWVNMIQRTQTGGLPDPVDPAPVERGINVYFTALDYAGMGFAVIEDRKFKSQPKNQPKGKDRVKLQDAVLLGDRQITFLENWTRRTEDMPIRWFLSQTMFTKANTNNGSYLKRNRTDYDSNGWPMPARDRALGAIGRDTIMVHGDQHISVLARLGIKHWDDGPLAFMVTGSSVGFPRAWWPELKPHDGLINNIPYTGRYRDDMGNLLTVHGVANPKPLPEGITDARNRPDFKDKGVFAVQDAKGSGHGMIVVDKQNRTARFEAYRLDFNAANPKPTDQFNGFPVTLKLR